MRSDFPSPLIYLWSNPYVGSGLQRTLRYRRRDNFLTGGEAALANGESDRRGKKQFVERAKVFGDLTIAHRLQKKRRTHHTNQAVSRATQTEGPSRVSGTNYRCLGCVEHRLSWYHKEIWNGCDSILGFLILVQWSYVTCHPMPFPAASGQRDDTTVPLNRNLSTIGYFAPCHYFWYISSSTYFSNYDR